MTGGHFSDTMLSDPLLLKNGFHEGWTMGIAGNGYASLLGKENCNGNKFLKNLQKGVHCYGC
jgi:hypothetical protein